MIRVALPYHLRNLAQVGDEVQIEVPQPATQKSLLDALEAKYPVLRGTIRDYATGRRRDFLRFYAGGEDYSNDPPDSLLPRVVTDGKEPFIVLGSIAGG